MKAKKTIGIIGGMGPLATIDLFNKIVSNTKAYSDSEHIHIYIDNYAQIPDRTKAILDNGPSPVPFIISSAKKLINCGADFLVIPCNTSHYYYETIQKEISVPIINMLDETMKFIKKNSITKACLFATQGTISTGLYDKYAKKYGVELVVPNPTTQELIMDLIYCGVKKGQKEYDVKTMQSIIDEICVKNNLPIILGCTELPIATEKYGLHGIFIDPTLILAKKAIEFAGYEQI